MNLLPIRNYIAANTDLVPRKTLLVFSMPADLKSGVVLVPSPVGGRIDHEIPGIYEERFQAIVRDPHYQPGMDRAEELFNLLTLLNVDMGEYVVDYCRPRHTPFAYPRSDSDLLEFSVNFDVRYRTR